MPHATDSTQVLTNGEKSSSKFVSHITSYPVVSDGIGSFKSNPYGRKSIDLADSAYQRFAKPVEPYLETPYSYAKPYLGKADELADSGLGRVETHFPIVKQDTNTIIDTGKSYIFWPFKLAGDGKEYVLSTFNDEYQKTAKHNGRGSGVATSVLAIISTELKIASDLLHAVADVLGPKYEEGKKKGSDLLKDAQKTADQYKQIGQDKAEQYKQIGQDKADQAQQEASKAKNDVQKKASK